MSAADRPALSSPNFFITAYGNASHGVRRCSRSTRASTRRYRWTIECAPPVTTCAYPVACRFKRAGPPVPGSAVECDRLLHDCAVDDPVRAQHRCLVTQADDDV